jgi:hypothetical protein
MIECGPRDRRLQLIQWGVLCAHYPCKPLMVQLMFPEAPAPHKRFCKISNCSRIWGRKSVYPIDSRVLLSSAATFEASKYFMLANILLWYCRCLYALTVSLRGIHSQCLAYWTVPRGLRSARMAPVSTQRWTVAPPFNHFEPAAPGAHTAQASTM